MAETNIKVIVGAIDNASNVLKNIGKNIEATLSKQAKTSVSGLTQATSGLQGAFGKLAGSAAIAGVAVVAVGAAIAGAYLAIKPFINASIQMENALLGVSTVARSFGIDAQEAMDAAKSLAVDGMMSVSDAAAGLKNLLATGFSLPQAINLMNMFKDSASFNRQGMLGFGEAIVGATQGIKNQNSIMVDNAGITKNLSNIIKEQGGSVSDLSEVTSDAGVRQKLYNGLLKEGAIFAGDNERAAGTLGGQLTQLKTATFALSAGIGDALAPGFQMITDLMKGALVNALVWVQAHMVGLQAAALVVGTTLAQLANIIVGVVRIIFGAIKSIFTLSFDPLKNAIIDTTASIMTTTTKAQEKMTSVAMKAAGVQTEAYEKSANKIADASSKKKDKLTRDLEKETESFEREMEKREKRFKEQLADMIYAHIDKRDSIIEDLNEENREYEEKMSDRTRDFKEKMDDMVAAHAEKVASINEQLAEEDANFQERMGDMKDSHDDKVKDIEKQIDRETAKGRSADQLRLEDLRDELAEENSEYMEETARKQAEHDKRLAAYQAELLKEEEEYNASRLRAQAKEEEETARLLETHNRRLADYQASIKQEEDVLNKHQADVAAVKDLARLDDITRLKLQYEEERKEAEEDHKRKLIEMKERAGAEGDSYNSGMAPKLGELEKLFEDSGKTAGENLAKGIGEGAKKAAENMISNFFSNLAANIRAMPKFMWEKAKEMLGLPSVFNVQTGGWGGGGAGWQTGGIVPGAVGEPMPILAHGGERVTPSNLAAKETGGGGITLNVSVGLYAGTETEKRNIAKELYSALVQVAMSQNKTVKELLGA